MQKRSLPELKAVLLVLVANLATVALNCHAQKMFPLPTYREAVDKAVSAENLKAAASKAADPEVLLGYAFLAPVGSPVRQEISDMAVKARPEYAPIATVLAIAMDGADEHSINELIKRDPDNALGHYLLAHQLNRSGKEKESLDAFRKAATCPELRLYGTTTANALFKAMDALNLKGRDRLAALSWMATRVSNFYIMNLQFQRNDLWEMVKKADLETRKEISELLLILGGHLFATNFENRQFAEWAVHAAFRLKAEIAAAEKSPTMNGYVAVVQALVSVKMSWPDIEDRRETPLGVAQFLPGRISRAFALVDPSQATGANLVELRANVPDSDKPAFEKAKQNAINAATALLDASLTDPDGIIGAYLKGLPPPKTNAPAPWVSSPTHVERLMVKRPDVFKAAAANERAMNELSEAGSSDPQTRNVRKMMMVGLAVNRYATDHDRNLPASLDVLLQDKKYLKDPDEAKSVLTGKPYVYIGAGRKLPDKFEKMSELILLYDDEEQNGYYQCVMGNSSGGNMPVKDVKDQIRKRGN